MVYGLMGDGAALAAAARDLPIYAGRDFHGGSLAEILARQPFMDKADLRRQFPAGFLRPGENLASLLASRRAEVVRTSGTSGDRLQVLWEAGWWERQERAALLMNPLMAPHLGNGYREAVLTTPLCSESVCKTGPTTMEERCVDHLLFLNTQYDPTHWKTGELDRMAAELERFQPAALEAAPTYLAALARHFARTGRQPPPLRWILLAYEFVCGHDRTAVREVFDSPIFEFYGLTEAGVFFLECPLGRLHFCGSESVVEVLRPENCGLREGVGEVVVTSWGNRAAPLLRYRTGDLVSVDGAPCGCGMRGGVLRRFEGRLRDVLAFPSGFFTPRDIDEALAPVSGIMRYRCTEEVGGGLRVAFVAEPPAGNGNQLAQAIEKCLGDRLKLAVRAEPVPFIAPEPSGKYRSVVPRA